MHELSIAQAIVDVALRNAGASRVTHVWVQVGHLRQVVPSALEFAFELCAQDTPVEGAVLELEELPVRVACPACGTVSGPTAFPLACEGCGCLGVEVVQGEELHVESLEVEPQAELSSSGGRP